MRQDQTILSMLIYYLHSIPELIYNAMPKDLSLYLARNPNSRLKNQQRIKNMTNHHIFDLDEEYPYATSLPSILQ